MDLLEMPLEAVALRFYSLPPWSPAAPFGRASRSSPPPLSASGALGLDGVNGDSQKRLSKPSWAGGVPKWDVPALSGNGDLGWYRCQDMTALNGSVVRLWDGDGGLTASPRRRGIMGIYH
uniref:Uncharacterized protein n=1 Tax=Ananas comosus var. bracteatus TaxID=296719 RepID=A0A6V7P963_ANACO|nr:unnamed protein product [Ananas comosus var. bracteatus]